MSEVARGLAVEASKQSPSVCVREREAAAVIGSMFL